MGRQLFCVEGSKLLHISLLGCRSRCKRVSKLSVAVLSTFSLRPCLELKFFEMEAVKKKMNTLKQTLDEAEGKAQRAEQELQEANERADAVSTKILLCNFDIFLPQNCQIHVEWTLVVAIHCVYCILKDSNCVCAVEFARFFRSDIE